MPWDQGHPLDVGSTVNVDPRMGPGFNNPGGPARVLGVEEASGTYSVKYIMGGREKDVEQAYVHSSNLLGFTASRRDSAVQGDFDRKRIQETHGEQQPSAATEPPKPKRSKSPGRQGTAEQQKPPKAKAKSPAADSAAVAAAASPAAATAASSGIAASSSKRTRWQANGHRWIRKRVRVPRAGVDGGEHLDDGRVEAYLPGATGAERWRVQIDARPGAPSTTRELGLADMKQALRAWTERPPPGGSKAHAGKRAVATGDQKPSKKSKSGGARRAPASSTDAGAHTQGDLVAYTALQTSPHALAPLDLPGTRWIDGSVAAPSSSQLVGRRIAVYWQEHATFYEADVEAFDLASGTHHIRFVVDAFECDWVLSEHVWFLGEPITVAAGATAAKSSAPSKSATKKEKGRGSHSRREKEKLPEFSAAPHPEAHFLSACRAPDGRVSFGHFSGRPPAGAHEKEKAAEAQVVQWVRAREAPLESS